MIKKLIKITFGICFLIAIQFSAKAQTQDKFVQFYLSSLENREKANELNTFLKSKDGVKMSRVDATGKTVYVIFESNKNYTESDFAAWLNEKGYEFTCFYSGVHGVDSFKVLKPEDCSAE